MAVPLPVPVIVLLEFKFAFLLLARLPEDRWIDPAKFGRPSSLETKR